MMKTYTYMIFVATTILTLFSSCDLDTNPTDAVDGKNMFTSVTDGEYIINGTWRFMMEDSYTYANPGFGSFLRAGDAMGSDAVLNTKYGFRNHYKFSAMYNKGGTGILSWSTSYAVINNMNAIINRIDEVEGNDNLRQIVKAQAYAMRGFIYLHLASNYSFALDKDPNAVCAPIYLKQTTEKTQPEPASSVQEVYNQALSDLEEANKILPANYNRNGEKHRIDKSVILGLLSRANLYARNWENAKNYSDELLAIEDYLMSEYEYKSGFNDIQNKEWIWGHPQMADQSDATYQFHYLDVTSPTSYYYSFNADPYFRDLFEDGDYRKTMIYWAPDPGKKVNEGDYAWMRFAKFKFKKGNLADIILMRTAEIYLINAEANAHISGQESAAIARLNELKTARQGATVSGLTGQALLDAIWIERRKELFGEGFALVDILRNQQSVVRKEFPDSPRVNYTYEDADGNSKTVALVPVGHDITSFPNKTPLVANSKYYLFRIPDKEERENKNLYSKYPQLDVFK